MGEKQEPKRITFKQARPNPLFQSWLEELYEEACDKNSKLKDMLKEALLSLSKYPLPLNTGADCAILQGFGKKLCIFLDKRLEVYNSLKTTDACDDPEDVLVSANCANKRQSHASESSAQNANTSPQKKAKTRQPKTFKPAHRSGGYAILIALLNYHNENPTSPSMSKELLIEKAQVHSEESFIRPKPNSFYTAWSNMSRLITKGLVNKVTKKKAQYTLTDQGIVIAKQLEKDSISIPSVNDVIFSQNDFETHQTALAEPLVREESQSRPSVAPVVDVILDIINMPKGTFDIVLLIDKNETGGVSKKNEPTVAQFNKYPNLIHEYRHLKVGDFSWIARCRNDKSKELVLPFIVERKRMDDLGSSIKDGRFHEQKFRLRKCGLENVMYVVENYGTNKHVGLPLQSLMQAIANTRVMDGFKVHITDGLTGTARFLAMMTKRLTVEYKDKNLEGVNGQAKGNQLMTFNHFNTSSAKTKALSVKETFIKLLLQLKGLSLDKALAITNVYSTPKQLIEAYRDCYPDEASKLLSLLKLDDLGKCVGPSVSETVYKLFTIKDF